MCYMIIKVTTFSHVSVLTVSIECSSAAVCGALWRQLWGYALPVKYSSINRHSAINFYLSVLIYPIMALGCFAMSNVLWRWAFHILYCFSLLLFFPLHRQKNVFTLLWNKTSEGDGEDEGWRGAEGELEGWGRWGWRKQWNLTRLKLYHFLTIPQGAGCLSAGLEKQRSPDW